MANERPEYIDEVLSAIHGVSTRVEALETQVKRQNGRVDKLEERASRNSDRAKAQAAEGSQSDLSQDAAIANLVSKVGSMETKVDATHKVVTGFATNPQVLMAGRLLVLLLAAYAANKGIRVLP